MRELNQSQINARHDLKVFLATLFVVAVITASTVYVTHRHREADQLREAQRIEAVTATLEIQCGAEYPRSPANQRHCVAEGLEK